MSRRNRRARAMDPNGPQRRPRHPLVVIILILIFPFVAKVWFTTAEVVALMTALAAIVALVLQRKAA